MFLTDFLVGMNALLADGGGGAAVTLMGRDEPDPAVVVSVVVTVHKSRQPLAGLRFAGERPAWVDGPVLDCAEQGFREGIVVRNPSVRRQSGSGVAPIRLTARHSRSPGSSLWPPPDRGCSPSGSGSGC